jgi:hypothetical protein
MNLTVGPLPPAVYWRRRALVAGALLVLVLLVVYACSGSSGSGAPGSSRANTGPANTPDPTGSELRPQTGSPPETGDPNTAPAAPPVNTAAPAVTTSPPSEFCADSEIRLTPTVQKITGGSFAYQLTLRIRNISNRTCKRDVGADPQELHITQNGQTLWSSDTCPNAQHGQPDVRTFGPGIEAMFTLGWDGTTGTGCTGGKPVTGGSYQVIAKLDTKASDPVTFTVAGAGAGS